MLISSVLVESEDFRVTSLTCTDSRPTWTEPESSPDRVIVLSRRGRFFRRTRHGRHCIVPGTAYLTVPDESVEFAYASRGNTCTSVLLSDHLWHSVVGEDPVRRTTFPVDPRVELAHRRVITSPDAHFDAAESLVDLLARAAAGAVARPLPGDADRAVVAAARDALLSDAPEAGGLVPLARSLAVSPYRLSRAFSAEHGVSLTRFRNQARVVRALERLEDGEPDLAGLAAELGFADQAHLTRTVRAHVGHTPAALRRMLADPRTAVCSQPS